LSQEQEAELNQLVCSRLTSVRLSQRARIRKAGSKQA
jgi:hypothetical protein